MKIDTDKLIQYMLEDAPPHENEVIQEQLKTNMKLKAEYQQLQTIWDEYNGAPLIKPSEHVQQRFDAWLDTVEHAEIKPKIRQLNWLRYAAAIALLAVASYAVFDSTQYTPANSLATDAIEEHLHWASSSSTTERIKGINSSLAEVENPEVIDLLIELLHSDESPNVRLAAVEGLATFSMSDQIRTGLIQALENEEKPVVQIALITTLVGLKESAARPKIEELIQREETDKYVKDEALLGLMRL